ncbi:NAD(P)-dependent oxidoreductase [Paenibacillus darwinianus]|uniref:NAD(P)-dependent oxidoreductase n=1 Tax=Paenibacillus darwinianus TaxID=1380763 RepID=UPI000449CCB9|nr:NAD(P)-dependent oxidoreductase [Paenibacillus darwinianus]EXX84777.1 6-phosphogluconate dehydrogenase [Paenibacillus darwinianus]EXX86084.1 6-phosphogluconate dehydrogenase [Paenibacillus darwinianus]
MHILFLGPGLMGESMARLLLKEGHRVSVLMNRNPGPVERLVEEGAEKVADLKKAASEADIVVSMLPNLPEIRQLLFERGVAEQMRPGSLFLTMSTVSPVGIQETAAKLRTLGIDVIDAPVSGGAVKAKDGTLTIMAGGEKETFERYLTILQILGEHIFHTGPVGTGQVVKLCNNLLAAIIMAANAEILTMGVKAGADSAMIRDIVMRSTGANRLLSDWLPGTMMVDKYEPGFALKLMYKDIELAMDLGKSAVTPMFLGGMTQQLYRMALGGDGGLADSDYSVVSTCYQDAAGVRIASGV